MGLIPPNFGNQGRPIALNSGLQECKEAFWFFKGSVKVYFKEIVSSENSFNSAYRLEVLERPGDSEDKSNKPLSWIFLQLLYFTVY